MFVDFPPLHSSIGCRTRRLSTDDQEQPHEARHLRQLSRDMRSRISVLRTPPRRQDHDDAHARGPTESTRRSGRLEEGDLARAHGDWGRRPHGRGHPGAEPMRSAYLTLRADSAKEAERLYTLLG